MAIPLKTLDEHRQYLHDIVRLKLFFLHRYLHRHPEESFREALHNRVDIYRKTDCNVGLLNPCDREVDFQLPAWLAMEDQLEKLFEAVGEDEAAFERDGFHIVKDSLDRRAPRDWLDVSRINGYQCGSLRYNDYPYGEQHDVIGFHIGNALQPYSMFENPLYLCHCFAELMRQTELKYGSTALLTSSWLNSLPKWQEFFPVEYLDNLEEPDTNVQWHYGFWGQFITSRGCFNAKYGDILRTTGQMPFYPRLGTCSFKAMRRHLKDHFGFDC